MDIKQEDLIKFWEWCGFCKTSEFAKSVLALDLDNIYKYAIPKLQDKGWNIELTAYEHHGFRVLAFNEFGKPKPPIVEEHISPTEALFNAILKVIDNEVKE